MSDAADRTAKERGGRNARRAGFVIAVSPPPGMVPRKTCVPGRKLNWSANSTSSTLATGAPARFTKSRRANTGCTPFVLSRISE